MKSAISCFLCCLMVAFTFGISVTNAGENARSTADSVSVRSLAKGGFVTVQKGFHAQFGKSTLSATRAVGFSPDGKLFSKRRMENVVVEGGELEQPLFMPVATLGTTADGQPMLVSDTVITASGGIIVNYTCSSGTLYANGQSTGGSKVCVGSNFVVKCTDDGESVEAIQTMYACANN